MYSVYFGVHAHTSHTRQHAAGLHVHPCADVHAALCNAGMHAPSTPGWQPRADVHALPAPRPPLRPCAPACCPSAAMTWHPHPAPCVRQQTSACRSMHALMHPCSPCTAMPCTPSRAPCAPWYCDALTSTALACATPLDGSQQMARPYVSWTCRRLPRHTFPKKLLRQIFRANKGMPTVLDTIPQSFSASGVAGQN